MAKVTQVDVITEEQLRKLTEEELNSLYDATYNRMKKDIGPGGDKYGIDWPTLFAIAPEWANRLKRLHVEMARRQRDAISLTYLDNGFFIISEKDARKLTRRLPEHGYEQCVQFKDKLHWLARTQHNGKMVWSLRQALA